MQHDQLAHQIGFPLDYKDISVTSEKRSEVVVLSNKETISLEELIEILRVGVVIAFTTLENYCESHQRNVSALHLDKLPNDDIP